MEHDKRQADDNKKEVQNFFVHAPHHILLPALVFVHSDAIVHVFLFFYKIRSKRAGIFLFLSHFALAREMGVSFSQPVFLAHKPLKPLAPLPHRPVRRLP
ncbi:hypothetical protein P9857_04735, partial [Anoxybacillus geothermalis]|nr:hypothetical protein [Anoxybacillus geothermalis]